MKTCISGKEAVHALNNVSVKTKMIKLALTLIIFLLADNFLQALLKSVSKISTQDQEDPKFEVSID